MSDPAESATGGDGRVSTEGTRAPGSLAVLGAIVRRELSTAVIRRVYGGLWIGLVAILLGITWFGGGFRVGYVSTIIDLLTPLELVIPVVAMAFGYRAILNDERRGELDVLSTYPVSPWQIVGGVYLGRAIGLVVIVSTALLVLLYPILITDPSQPLFYARHTGADSIWLYVRFVVLTVTFALVLLAVAVAISALVSSTRTAVAGAALALFVLLFGADLAIVYGLAQGLIADSSVIHSLALSPLSAYRGLVLETTVTVTTGTGPQTASPIASVIGLLAWAVGSLAITALAVRR